MTIKIIEQNIFKLNPLKRIRLIESLIASLNKPDLTVERAWAAESDRRLKAYRNGSVRGID
ncbi:MAG: addiction module protein, partial [Candidatus Omnitrophica bacterium]|nr:addiction module protein [Candidatus Omnitrophota bacterium]